MALNGGKIEWSKEAPTREKIWFFAVLGLILYAFNVWMWGPEQVKTKMAQDEAKQSRSQVETLEKVLAMAVKPAVPTVDTPKPASKNTPATDLRFAPYLKGELKTQEQILQSVSEEFATPKILGAVTLHGLNFGSATDKGDYLEIPFDLVIEATYQETVGYLQRIEKKPVLAVFRGANVQAKSEDPNRLETHLTSSAFVVKSAAAIIAPSAAAPAGNPPAAAPHGATK